MPFYHYAIGVPAMLEGLRKESFDYIQHHGISALARQAGIHRNTLRQWLNGKPITVHSLLAIASALAKAPS